MSRSLSLLTTEVRTKAECVRNHCSMNGVDLLIYCTLRPLEEQARLYRKSRTREQILAKQNRMRERGYGFLANIITHVGPQSGTLGEHVTFAGPGESWHGYAEAFDGVPLIGGKPCWSAKVFPREWKIYGEAVNQAGLNWAGDWVKFKEYPHAQLRMGSNPLRVYDPVGVMAILVSNNLL